MTNNEKMINLMRRLKSEMNGAVVEAMTERGIHYSLSYGVSTATINAVASQYAPDHALAKLLYRQDVRELRLAALYIAEFQRVDPSELDFWGEGIVNSEIAEYVAFVLLGKSSFVEQIMLRWLASSRPELQYTALMSGARYILLKLEIKNWNIEQIDNLLSTLVDSCDRDVRRGVTNFLSRLLRIYPGQKVKFSKVFNKIELDNSGAYSDINDELSWQLVVDPNDIK